MIADTAHAPARPRPGLTAYQTARRARAYQPAGTLAVGGTRFVHRQPACPPVPAYQALVTMAIVAAHTPARPGPGLSAYLTTGCPGAHQRVGTLVIGTACIADRPARAYPSPAGQTTGTVVVDAASPASSCPARSRAANQRAGTVAIETAHVPARTSTGLTAYQGTRRAGAYKITSTPVIVRTGTADCYPARTIPAHKRIGTVVVVAAHTPARTSTGLTTHQGTGRTSAYQGTSTPVIVRTGSPGCYPAHPGAAYQRVGTVVIVPAHTSARTAPGLTAHQGAGRAGAYKSTSTPVIVRTGAADCYPARTIPAYQAGLVQWSLFPHTPPAAPDPG